MADVKLQAPCIPYLDRETIEEFSTLKFLSDTREIVKVNPVILAAVNSSLIESVNTDDYEDICVITDFTRHELESINQFSWTGQVDNVYMEVFRALGVDPEHMFDRRPPPIPANPEVKIKVKDEPLELDNDSDGQPRKKYKAGRKPKVAKELLDFIDDEDFDDFDPDEEEDDDDDFDYHAEKVARKKRKSALDDFWDGDDSFVGGDDFGWNDYGYDEKKFDSVGGDEPPKKSKRGRKPGSKKRKVSTKSEPLDEDDLENNDNAEMMNNSYKLTEEQEVLFAAYELPKPLEEFKQAAQEPRVPVDEAIKDNPLACHLCPARFKNDQGLQGHLIKFHSEHYSCTSCYKAFGLNEVDKFKLHMFKHSQQGLLGKNYCIQCGASFQRSNGLHEHQKLRGQFHDDQCAQCQDRFTSFEDYQSHVNLKHDGKWKWKCGFCRELFDEKRELRSHFKTFHEANVVKPNKNKYVPKKTICTECGKLVYNLKNHMVATHGNEKHPCPHCGLVLKTNPRLQKHISWIHVTAPCTECGEMVGVGKMTRHIEQKHTSIYDRKFKCDVCGKGFSDNTKLRDHKNVHTGEKPYKCKFCSAAFASAGSHATHQKGHLGFRRSK